MIDKFQYVVHSKPEIALSIGIVARFLTNPKENHMMGGKGIMRYLKGTEDYGMYYKKNENFELSAYTDVDWDGNIDDIKSISAKD